MLVIGCSDQIVDPVPIPPPPHFTQFVETASSHHLVIETVSFDRESLESGWEIGVFTWRGELAGSGIWRNNDSLVIEAFGSNDTVAQFNLGDEFDFRLWDTANQIEKHAEIVQMSDQRTWTAGGVTKVSIDGFELKNQSINLNVGWNLISINLVPIREKWNRWEGPDIRKMFAQLEVGHVLDVIWVKNERGEFYYRYTSRPDGFNSIPFWCLDEGYQVYVDKEITCQWEGKAIPSYQFIYLAEGWNMIAYYPDYPLSCDSITFNAISSIASYVLWAKDEAGRTASPDDNYSNMLPWQPGKAYQIRVSRSCRLRYPEPEAIAPIIPRVENIGYCPWTEPSHTGENMSLMVKNIKGVRDSNGDAVGAFDSSGRLVGLCGVTGGKAGLAIWGDDPMTPERDGMMTGERFELRYWSASTGKVTVLSQYEIVKGAGMVYETDAITAGTFELR